MFAPTPSEKILLETYIQLAIQEDQADPLNQIPTGDHSALACLSREKKGRARLLVKSEGVLAGVALAKMVMNAFDPELQMEILMEDGAPMKQGDIAFHIEGSDIAILGAERIILNCMQRMSGIATLTAKYVAALANTKTKVLDTRKTTPNFRAFEKWAVRIGGGQNHRFGLYDMIMLKDNHIDFCGGITKAVDKVKNYQAEHGLNLRVVVEARNLQDVEEILATNYCHRVMFDNFSVQDTQKGVELVEGQIETESSGGITLDTITAYAETGVNFISVGALTHSYTSLDLSLKAF